MSSLFDLIENTIKEHWISILVIILGLLAWKFDLFYDLIKGTLPLIGIMFLGWWAWKFWVHYIQQDFISGITWVLLEIVPPREVLRSPQAMELFITNALYHWSNKGGKEEYWQGAVWFWFSLEIVSIDGQVHFYIRAPSRIQSLIETQMYAQYPQAQVKVVEDYTLAIDEISKTSEWNAWGCEFETTKPVSFPIKTYVDFGLDEDPKEEYKVDPISPVIELFGSIQKGEQMWMQIVVTPSKNTYRVPGTWFEHVDWQKEVERELLEMLEPYTGARARGDRPGKFGLEIRAPKYMDDLVDGASRKMQKLGFETGVRIMYVAKKDIFPIGVRSNNSRNIRLIFRQYESPFANGFKRINSTQGDALGSSIMSLSKKQVMILVNRMLNEFRERNFFHHSMRHRIFSEHNFSGGPFNIWGIIAKQFFLPYVHQKTYVLNSEELATLWHFPGQILKVPTLERIESKEASPPTNLPT
ncbi:MAG: hypothetical protein Q8O46_04610 [bacterium]|nr:hypothetical protein [bacterium]